MPTPRHLHVGLSIGLALVSLTVGFGAVDLVSPWVLHEGTQVTDVGFGTLTGLVIPIGLLTPPRRAPPGGAGVLQTGLAALARSARANAAALSPRPILVSARSPMSR